MAEPAYDRLKELTRDLDGSLRGNLGRRLTEAVNMYCDHMEGGDLPEDRGERIESDISTINRNIAELKRAVEQVTEEAEADGGSYTVQAPNRRERREGSTGTPEVSEPEVETRSETETDDSDPLAEAPRDPPASRSTRPKRARWLAGKYTDRENVHRDHDLRATVDEEYAYDDGPAASLVDAALELLPHVPHPGQGAPLYVSPDRADELREQIRETNAAEAAERDAELEAGEVVR